MVPTRTSGGASASSQAAGESGRRLRNPSPLARSAEGHGAPSADTRSHETDRTRGPVAARPPRSIDPFGGGARREGQTRGTCGGCVRIGRRRGTPRARSAGPGWALETAGEGRRKKGLVGRDEGVDALRLVDGDRGEDRVALEIERDDGRVARREGERRGGTSAGRAVAGAPARLRWALDVAIDGCRGVATGLAGHHRRMPLEPVAAARLGSRAGEGQRRHHRRQSDSSERPRQELAGGRTHGGHYGAGMGSVRRTATEDSPPTVKIVVRPPSPSQFSSLAGDLGFPSSRTCRSGLLPPICYHPAGDVVSRILHRGSPGETPWPTSHTGSRTTCPARW